MKKWGFTLIELIVVIAIIAVLAAIIAPSAFKAIEKARISSTLEDFNSIKTAAMSYFSDVGSHHTPCNTTANCVLGFVTNNSAAGWDGPYIEKWSATNRWGGLYQWCVVTTADLTPCLLWDADAPEEAYVRLTNVTSSAAAKIDVQVDGAPGCSTAGNVRYDAGTPTNVSILVIDN